MRPKRSPNSIVRRYFVKNDNKSATCTICRNELKSSGNTTKHLIGHLRSNHSILFKENVIVTKLKRKMAQIASATSDHSEDEIADNSEPETSTSTSEADDLQDEEIRDYFQNTTTEDYELQPTRAKKKLKKSFRDEREDDAYKFMKKAAHEILTRDEFCTFGTFVADNVRKLNRTNQIVAKCQITNMLLDLQIKEDLEITEMETCESQSYNGFTSCSEPCSSPESP